MTNVLLNTLAEKPSRKKGAILLLHPIASGSSVERTVKRFADSVGAPVHVCERLADLPAIRQRFQSSFNLAVFSRHFIDIVGASRTLHAGAPFAEILFLCSSSQEQDLRGQLGPIPRIGTHWRCADPENEAFLRPPCRQPIVEENSGEPSARRSTVSMHV